ncbi:recombination-associated protein RdgC [Plesiomonas shigelloides]|uniref:recombination-associated protein RdgC n=1 Tax=Plesiomonas shigelloides TaxID=703 RepID=UPI00143E3939|nr:recombination-associated protein RdgC [Plesiomonas shigelloides]QIY07878.1 recombination-associated protein RdgC [Plesiomonas shigelloides]
MMWFKNLIIYNITRSINFDAERLEQQLADFAFSPCSSQERARLGWVPVIDDGESLIHVSGHHILLHAHRETKILPAEVINYEAKAKVAKQEAEQQRKLKEIERRDIRDEVWQTLLPRAFSKHADTLIWIDTKSQQIIIDVNSHKQAEDMLALLRKTIGSLPVAPLNVQKPIELTLTEWVRSSDLPAGFSLLESAELKSALEGGGVIRCKQQELASDEIASHIEAQKMVTKLELNWQDRINFMLCNNFAIKRIKFADQLREQNDDINLHDQAARFDADFTLMTGELSALINDLNNALGGKAES